MPDNILIDSAGGVKSVATTNVGEIHTQHAKIVIGEAGAVDPVSATNPMPTEVTNLVTLAGAVPKALFRFADINGDGSGANNAIGVYTPGTPGVFRVTPPAGAVYRITRMVIQIEDAAGMDVTNYGNLGAPLAEGIAIRTHNGASTIVDVTNGEPVQSNGCWGARCYDANLLTWGTGNDLLVVRWSFDKSGVPLRLVGDDNEELQIICSDDMSGLVKHTFFVNGYIEGV